MPANATAHPTKRFEQKLRRLAPLPTSRPTAAKYRPIAERLERVANEFPPDTRLPSIRALAGLFDVTAVPIQRAVSELVQRGVLYAHGGRGVYVAQRARGNAPLTPEPTPEPLLADSDPFNPVPTQCTLGVSLQLPQHRGFWRQALDRFEQHYPLIHVDLQACRSLEGAPPLERFDVRELAPASAAREPQRPPLVDLSDFRGETDTHSPLALLAPTMALVHLSVPCVFYNKALLRKHNIAPPQFDTFAEQVRYFESLPMRDSPVAESVVQPLAWLGGRVQTLLDWLRGDAALASDERDEIVRAIETFARMRRTLRALSGRHAFNADRFAEGTLPIFHGWSYNYGYLASKDLPFEFGVVPWLGSDDRLFALPLCVAISDEASHCTECVRLVRHLQSPEAQQLLAATGNVPFDARFSDSSFLARDSAPDFIRALFEHVYVHPVTTPGDSYLSRHVINDELWRVIHARAGAAEALDEMLWLGRGASRQFARRRRQAAPSLAR